MTKTYNLWNGFLCEETFFGKYFTFSTFNGMETKKIRIFSYTWYVHFVDWIAIGWLVTILTNSTRQFEIILCKSVLLYVSDGSEPKSAPDSTFWEGPRLNPGWGLTFWEGLWNLELFGYCKGSSRLRLPIKERLHSKNHLSTIDIIVIQ